MAILKRGGAMLALLGLSSCLGDQFTVTKYLETDTYISSVDGSPHADSATLRLSKSGDREDRVLFKLPTGQGSQDDDVSAFFKNDPVGGIVLLPFFITLPIFASIFDCQSSITAANLTSAKLDFNVASGTPGTVALTTVSRPWWQNADWSHAHYFSSGGSWASGGGDVDASFTPIAGTLNGAAVGFDVTDYFRTLIGSAAPVHFGMLMTTAAGGAPVELVSSQGAPSTARPRVVATYNCPFADEESQVRTYYLGSLSGRAK